MDDILSNYKCGTRSQYFRHHKAGETPCEPCKEANREYNRKRSVSRKDAIYEQQRRWYDNNLEHVKKYQTEYYEANREEIAKATREYQKAHPEKRAVWSKTYSTKYPEKVRENSRRWTENNLDRVRESKRSSQRRRKARKRENGVESYKEAQVLDLYGVTCHLCQEPIDLEAPRKPGTDGWEKGLHIDHLVPISKGGADALDNVRPSHAACNMRKHNKEKTND